MAYKYLEKMKKKPIIVTPYLDPQIVEDIYRHMGIEAPVKPGRPRGRWNRRGHPG